jgi:hypothetical protein
MKNAALKILGLMTFTLLVACGDDPAAPMITEIETSYIQDNQISSHVLTEVDYRNGNEIDFVSTYRDGQLSEQSSYYYDSENDLVNRIDSTYRESQVATMLAEYDSNSNLSSLSRPSNSVTGSVRFRYKNGYLSSISSANFDFQLTYNQKNQLEMTESSDFSINFRWTDDVLTSLRTTNSYETSKTEFFYNPEGKIYKTIVGTNESQIFYDEQGRIEEISTYFSGSNFRKITTYRYADGTVAGAQPTPEFEGGIYFGMDGKPLAELPMITLKGFSIDD